MFGDIASSQPIPPAVAAVLQQSASFPGQHVKGGFSSNLCWLLAQGQLLLWRHADGVDARIITITLPAQLSRGADCFVSVLGGASNTNALVATSTGLVLAWPNIGVHLNEPIVHQVATGAAGATVTAFTAVAPAPSSGMLFVAALTFSDGSLHLVQGNQQGMHAKQLATGHATGMAGAAAPEQRSMLSSAAWQLGNALANAYTEALNPNAKYTKLSASGRPALALHARMVDVHHLHIYLLTEATLECWQVTVGLRLSEQLLWSSQTDRAARAVGKVQMASNRAVAFSEDTAYLMLEGTAQDGSRGVWVHRMLLRPEGPPSHLACTRVPELQGRQGSPASLVDQLHACHSTLLLHNRDHSLYEWVPGGPCSLVTDDQDTLAVTAVEAGPAQDGQGGSWLLLNTTYGVAQISVGSVVGHAEQVASGPAVVEGFVQGLGAAELTVEQRVQVSQALDATLGQAAAVQAAGQPLMTVAMGLKRRLQGLGVLASSVNMGVVAAYSTGLVDTLPKQWSMGGAVSSGGGGLGVSGPGHSVAASLLAAKQSKHTLLMDLLSQAVVLHLLPPVVQRTLLENSEKLTAAMSVLSLHTHLIEEVTAQGGGQQGDPLPLVVQVISKAGTADGRVADQLPTLELFYARPSASLPTLLQQMGEAAAMVREQATSGLGRPGDASAHGLLGHVCSLGQLLGHVMSAVQTQRVTIAAAYRLEGVPLYRSLGSPSWLADKAARDALDSLALACQAVRQLLLSQTPGARGAPTPAPTSASPELVQLATVMFGCVEVLLAAYAAAMVTVPGGDAQQAVLEDYQGARSRCLATLLVDALAAQSPASPLPNDCLLLQVQQLAAAHHCYPVLFDACERVDGWVGSQPGASLHYHMTHVTAELGAPPQDTFARYCFQRLLDDQRPADLLQLPPSFYPALRHFLQQQPQHAGLLWPLLFRTQDWGDAVAAVTLDAEAQVSSCGQQQRLFSLAVLCATLAGDAPTAIKAGSRVVLLAVQQELVSLSQELGLQAPTQGAVDPGQLLDHALALEGQGAQGRGALLALRVLADSSLSVQQANRSKLQDAWHHVVCATNWHAIHDHYAAGATGDAPIVQSPLYQAAMLCAGNGLFGQGGAGVTDTAPRQEVASWVHQWTGEDPVANKYATEAFMMGVKAYQFGGQE